MPDQTNQRNIAALSQTNKRLEQQICELRVDLNLARRGLAQVQAELQQMRAQVSLAMANTDGRPTA